WSSRLIHRHSVYFRRKLTQPEEIRQHPSLWTPHLVVDQTPYRYSHGAEAYQQGTRRSWAVCAPTLSPTLVFPPLGRRSQGLEMLSWIRVPDRGGASRAGCPGAPPEGRQLLRTSRESFFSMHDILGML